MHPWAQFKSIMNFRVKIKLEIFRKYLEDFSAQYINEKLIKFIIVIPLNEEWQNAKTSEIMFKIIIRCWNTLIWCTLILINFILCHHMLKIFIIKYFVVSCQWQINYVFHWIYFLSLFEEKRKPLKITLRYII